MASSINKSIGLYEFLIEAELQQYYNPLKSELKVTAVHQLKYVTEEDLIALGFSKPEIRRLKKFFHKHCPPNYLSKFKNIIKPKKEDQISFPTTYPDSEPGSSHQVRVPSKHIIPAEAIVVNKELGVGEFGVVQQGVWTNEDGDRIQVAIKCLSNERLQTNPMEFLKEAAIMHTIDQEHIVRLYGVVLDTNALMLVTELAPLRSLLECLKEPALKFSFTVPVLCDFAIQICDGMHYLESKRLIHRDLAARNILVYSKNKVKISDFGLSRALGVGKDYYQTNFNVNLKLPIAWCAPECINFLRFTSASDVWAFGVTLWEMFSYGFQPWAALTGQQILEAIDEPNFQRLEQPECCPREHYSLMSKCWQHDPSKRPKFSDLLLMLPDCKPEQVQAVADYQDDLGRAKRDQLVYRTGDIITVLDKRPMADVHNCWKGVLNNGKDGLFNPANTVTYIGTNLPSTKSSSFSRGDGKNAYSSKRRLRPEMISCPQGDVKHTGHVGLDGAYFGDIAFLADKYNQLPKQVVTPYKPQDDDPTLSPSFNQRAATLPKDREGKTQPSVRMSEKAPLLTKPVEGGKIGPAADHNWSDSASEPSSSAPPTPGFLAPATAALLPPKTREKPSIQLPVAKNLPSVKHVAQTFSHEYHEISDEEPSTESPRFEGNFDLGPSLMDEIFSSLGATSNSPMNSSYHPQGGSYQNSIQSGWESHEPAAHVLPHKASSVLTSLKDTLKKKHATVKPISASDERTLDQAIAMANEIASRSMLELDKASGYQSSNLVDSMFSSSEDYVSRGTESPHSPVSPARSKFSFKRHGGKGSPKSERRHFAQEAASIPDIQACLSEDAKDAYNMLIEKPLDTAPPSYPFTAPLTPSDAEEDSNPLRMLRAGVMVRPRVRGNKHQSGGVERSTSLKTKKVGPPVNPKPKSVNRPSPLVIRDSNLYREPERAAGEAIWLRAEDDANELPLPPRDRNKPIAVGLPRHQRKHPLVMPQGMGEEEVSPTDAYVFSSLMSTDMSQDVRHAMGASGTPVNPLAKPPRVQPPVLDDSYDGQIASELEALEMIDETDSLSPLGLCPGPIHKKADHVSCEDLLEFACDRPNAKRTQGPARGVEADEVRIMQKVLGKEKLNAFDCVSVLDSTDWNVHNAIKLAKCRATLPKDLKLSDDVLTQSLSLSNWDVNRAATYILTMNSKCSQ